MPTPLSIIEQDNYIVVTKHDKRYVLDVHHDAYNADRLTCRFLEKDKDILAHLFATAQHPKLLVHRNASILEA